MRPSERAHPGQGGTAGRNAVIAAIAGVAILAGAAGYGAGISTGASPDTRDRTWIDDAAEARGERTTAVVARQFRGLDVAMIEMDHRYAELYFAARDRNWEYAEHQVEHMEVALDRALERRPERAASARAHFYPVLERLEHAVEAADPEAVATEIEALRRACNACHEAEGEPAFVVGVPSQRRSSIGAS